MDIMSIFSWEKMNTKRQINIPGIALCLAMLFLIIKPPRLIGEWYTECMVSREMILLIMRKNNRFSSTVHVQYRYSNPHRSVIFKHATGASCKLITSCVPPGYTPLSGQRIHQAVLFRWKSGRIRGAGSQKCVSYQSWQSWSSWKQQGECYGRSVGSEHRSKLRKWFFVFFWNFWKETGSRFPSKRRGAGASLKVSRVV